MGPLTLRLEKRGRRLNCPAWVFGVVALFLLFVYLCTQFARGVTLCPFKLFTGYSCPSCGTTRAVLAAMEGEFLTGFLYNPMMVLLLTMVVLVLLVRLTSGYQIVVRGGSKGWNIAAGVVLAASFLTNWSWILWHLDGVRWFG